MGQCLPRVLGAVIGLGALQKTAKRGTVKIFPKTLLARKSYKGQGQDRDRSSFTPPSHGRKF